MERPVAECSCCGRKFTREEWFALPLCGTAGDEVEFLELRNCPCKSTISVTIGGQFFDLFVKAIQGNIRAASQVMKARSDYTAIKWWQISQWALEKVTS